LMCDQLNLTAAQVDVALAYIQAHRVVVEGAYQTALQTREDIYQYWAKHNYDRFAQIAARPERSDYPEARAKLRSRQQQRVAQGSRQQVFMAQQFDRPKSKHSGYLNQTS
jgi:hypothetical protein